MAWDENIVASQLMQQQEKMGAMEMSVNLRAALERQLANAHKEVERISELLALLEKNPDVKRIFELMGHGHRI